MDGSDRHPAGKRAVVERHVTPGSAIPVYCVSDLAARVALRKPVTCCAAITMPEAGRMFVMVIVLFAELHASVEVPASIICAAASGLRAKYRGGRADNPNQ